MVTHVCIVWRVLGTKTKWFTYDMCYKMVDTWAISMLARVSHLDRDVIWKTITVHQCSGTGTILDDSAVRSTQLLVLSVWRRVSSCCWQRPGASGANYKSTKICGTCVSCLATNIRKQGKHWEEKAIHAFVTSCGNFIYNVHALTPHFWMYHEVPWSASGILATKTCLPAATWVSALVVHGLPLDLETYSHHL